MMYRLTRELRPAEQGQNQRACSLKDLTRYVQEKSGKRKRKRLLLFEEPYRVDRDVKPPSPPPSPPPTSAPSSSLGSSSASPSSAWDWLLERCLLHQYRLDHPVMSGADLASTILEMVTSNVSADALQSHLLDVLGMSEESFDFLIQIMERRKEFSPSSSSTRQTTANNNDTKRVRDEAPIFAPSSRGAENPDWAGPVNVETDDGNGFTVQLPTFKAGSRPAGTKEIQVTHKRLTGPGSKSILGAVGPKKTKKGEEAAEQEEPDVTKYIQVNVPAKTMSRADTTVRVPISSFNSLGQIAFKNIECLNRLQSIVFEAAYHTNHNLLVCAPTGAGKTNVAMMTVVREIERHAEDIHRVKIIYVAPMKALAQEIVTKFGKRLTPLGVKVRELTGDMQLTRREIEQTQLIVTTPEKWDVITRKSGDGTLVEAVGLLIIDEVHLIGEDRGPVIESLVARTLRLVEQKQKMVRIVGLSATLPNYRDAAQFLRVDPKNGLFFFDNAFRPVPLDQTFIGINEKNFQKRRAMLNDIAFEKAVDSVNRGHQVMVFVHSRKDTANTAQAMLEAARAVATPDIFESCSLIKTKARSLFEKDVAKSKTSELRHLFARGVGIHHAGMPRADRTLTEKMFEKQAISVLCCTATLAWGVNLPVHTVIIKGTQVYVAEKGGLVELNMQDVFQCFGRAGRPQYDTRGEAVLITDYDQLNRYLSMLNHALPLESLLSKRLPDALNAEIVSGTVTNLREAIEWLSYTFLYVRMLRNPNLYGVGYNERDADPTLQRKRAEIIVTAAKVLDIAKMSRFASRRSTLSRTMPDLNSPFGVTDLGRIASHYYIGYATMEEFNNKLVPDMSDAQVLDLLCHASEFSSLKVRDEEVSEISKLQRTGCAVEVLAPPGTPRHKAIILLQCYITRVYISSFTLASDMTYISQNMGRVAQAVFEMCLKKRWSGLSEQMLQICIALDKRCWWAPYAHPLRQLAPALLPLDVVARLEEKGESCHIENLVEMDANEIGGMIRHQRMGQKILRNARKIPFLQVSASIQPLTRSILRITLDIYADFEWTERLHGSAQHFWLWVDDQNSEWIYHHEQFVLRYSDFKKQKRGVTDESDAKTTSHKMHPALAAVALQTSSHSRREFTVPIFEPLPPQYFLRVFSANWLGSESVIPLTLDQLVLPPKTKQHTDLLILTPLPRSALNNAAFEKLYAKRFTHFNPIQTQIFHVMYHTKRNVLLGAPTGSGKTISSELALLAMFRDHPGCKAVYIAPLKALVSERVKEWKGSMLNKRVVEFTGDVSPDPQVLRSADILISTPEKWDGASRMWQQRDYVQKVRLVIIDEIHLLGEERGAILEVIVTRMRYIATRSGVDIRIVGLSTALANAVDLGNWLGIEEDGVGLFNFRPSVRPVPIEAHISGFPGKHYCPRMATMNKPAYAAILTHSPSKPVLIFVASRRQTRLTAIDLISLSAASDNPRQFLHMPFQDLEALQSQVKDETLQHTLSFGIGIHHAGLDSKDREIVEHLFVTGKIQILCCTSTLAWGVNFPAHLVIIKGTEYFDGKSKRYQPFPVTDVLQMMGRAGRPQFDATGVAVIMVAEELKPFYKKFLYEPFPVESHLPDFLHNHLLAEIAINTISEERQALDYLSWTYFFRRLPMNPSYYGLENGGTDAVAVFLIQLIRQVLVDLEDAKCIVLKQKLNALSSSSSSGGLDNWRSSASVTVSTSKELLDKKLAHVNILPTQLGKICSFYYLDYRTMKLLSAFMQKERQMKAGQGEIDRRVLALVASTHEYSEVPVRHNEDVLNLEYVDLLPWNPFTGEEQWSSDSSHAKAFILLMAHCRNVPVPIKDYVNDTKSVLDQSLRIINALIEVAVVEKLTHVVLSAMNWSRSIVQGHWFCDPAQTQLRYVSSPEDVKLTDQQLAAGAEVVIKDGRKRDKVVKLLRKIPKIRFASVRSGNGMEVLLECASTSSTANFSGRGYYKGQQRYTWWILVEGPGEEVLACKHLSGLPKKFKYSIASGAVKVRLVSGTLKGLDQELPA